MTPDVDGTPRARILPMDANGGPPPPAPTGLQVETIDAGGRAYTVITRSWRREDLPRCRLCATCKANADGAFCTIIAQGVVTPKEARSFGLGRGRVPGDDGDAALDRLAGRGVVIPGVHAARGRR